MMEYTLNADGSRVYTLPHDLRSSDGAIIKKNAKFILRTGGKGHLQVDAGIDWDGGFGVDPHVIVDVNAMDASDHSIAH